MADQPELEPEAEPEDNVIWLQSGLPYDGELLKFENKLGIYDARYEGSIENVLSKFRRDELSSLAMLGWSELHRVPAVALIVNTNDYEAMIKLKGTLEIACDQLMMLMGDLQNRISGEYQEDEE